MMMMMMPNLGENVTEGENSKAGHVVLEVEFITINTTIITTNITTTITIITTITITTTIIFNITITINIIRIITKMKLCRICCP